MSDLVFNTTGVKEKPEEKKRPSLTEDELEIITYVEQFYWENGTIPSIEIISNKLDIDVSKINRAWGKDHFRNTLVLRGLQGIEKKREGVLSPVQVVLVNMLLNVGDKSSLRQKLESLQITQTQYNAWLRDEVFQGYLRKRTEQMFEFSDHEAFKSLLTAVMDGDVQALKLFFEMRGIYNPKLTVDINIETTILKIVEVVAKHVKDPNIIQAIAHDVEKIDLPGNRALSQI